MEGLYWQASKSGCHSSLKFSRYTLQAIFVPAVLTRNLKCFAVEQANVSKLRPNEIDSRRRQEEQHSDSKVASLEHIGPSKRDASMVEYTGRVYHRMP